MRVVVGMGNCGPIAPKSGEGTPSAGRSKTWATRARKASLGRFVPHSTLRTYDTS
jgi:hypothetical protein